MRHRFHAICPYFAMFPESFAEHWINELSRRGDIVLDPFSGRGTTAFQALLLDRRAVACDVNDVAYCVTKAKVDAPPLSSLIRRLNELERHFSPRQWTGQASQMGEFFHYAYSPSTLLQTLFLRHALKWKANKTDGMIAALTLGALHGESQKSPSYLSNQMPRTISTKPGYSVKFWKNRNLTAPDRDAFELLRKQARYRYESSPPKGEATVIHGDMRKLAWVQESLPSPIKLAITSPPYLDVTNFEEDQWLRLWFLGGPPYPTRHRVSRDDRHESKVAYWAFIADMWRMLGSVMSKKGHVVIRLGGRGQAPEAMVKMLGGSSGFCNRRIQMVSHSVSVLQKRQTDSFRPGSKGCSIEIDCHFQFLN